MYKHFFLLVAVCSGMLLYVAGCSREPQNAKVPRPSAATEVVATTTVLGTIADDERPQRRDAISVHKGAPAVQNQPAAFDVTFSERGGGVVYLAKQGGSVRVVHNDRRGGLYKEINSYYLAISPDGQRVAYGAKVDEMWHMMIDGKEVGAYDEIGPPVFSPDGIHVAYEAKTGERWHIVADGKRSPGAISYYDKPVFSKDSAKILYIENAEGDRAMRVVVADPEFKKMSFHESGGAQLIINSERTRAAMVREEGKNGKRVIEFSFSAPDKVTEGQLYDDIAFPAFGYDGVSVTYAALKNGKRLLILNGREEPLPHANLVGVPVIRPDLQEVGCIMAAEGGYFLHHAFVRGSTKEKRYDDAADLVYNRDGSLYAYAAKKDQKIFVVVNDREGPGFDMVIKPMFSPDGKLLVYRARKDGKRFVVVADANGKTVRQHPAYEQVFQPVFTADGKSVAYGVKDGNKLIWKVEKL